MIEEDIEMIEEDIVITCNNTIIHYRDRQRMRRNLPYQGIARRRMIQVGPLPQGALPTYDMDIDVAVLL